GRRPACRARGGAAARGSGEPAAPATRRPGMARKHRHARKPRRLPGRVPVTMASRSDTLLSRIRWSGALAAVAALTALVAIGPPGRAYAASGTSRDQITGAGLTNSAVTVNWSQGLLDNTNKPIAAANADRGSANPTSPLSFMYPDFKNLQLTVSQTQDIT